MSQKLDWPFLPSDQPGWNRRGDEPWDWQTQGYTGLAKHEGRDYGLAQGSPYYASGNGQIVDKWVGWIGGGGGGWGTHYVIRYDDVELIDGTIIDHLFVRTAHMDRAPLDILDEVTRGQVIGTSGNTGTSTGPHLHLETRVGFRRNPNGAGGSPRGDLIDPARVFWWPPVPTTPPTPKDWLDMATEDEVRKVFREEIAAALATDKVTEPLRNHVYAALDQRAERIEANTKKETERTRDEFVQLLVDKGVIKKGQN